MPREMTDKKNVALLTNIKKWQICIGFWTAFWININKLWLNYSKQYAGQDKYVKIASLAHSTLTVSAPEKLYKQFHFKINSFNKFVQKMSKQKYFNGQLYH